VEIIATGIFARVDPQKQSPTEPWIPSEEQYLFLFLKDRDVFCPLCNYNLRNLTVPRCPECGRDVRLAIGLTEPFMRWWIALCCAVVASAGIGALFWMLLARGGWPREGFALFQVAFVYLLASPLLAAPVLIYRRTLLKWPRSAQRLLAIIAIVVSVAAVIIFFAMIR